MSNMSVLIFVSLAPFVAYVLAWGLYHLKKKFPKAPLPSPLVRIGEWANRLIAHRGDDKTATFGDLVLFVTLWVIAFTLWFISAQGAEEKYKEELRQANERAMGLEGQLRDQQRGLESVRAQITFPLPVLPRPDEQIIGNHVDLQWESQEANSGQDYVIEVTKVAGNSGHIPAGIPCMYEATEPSVRRSHYPIKGNEEIESGTYIWRVGVGSLQHVSTISQATEENWNPAENPCPTDARIRTWSGYSKFTIYHTQKERLLETGEVIIGTNFSQGSPFTAQDDNGRPRGFEIDLIRTIIQDCLATTIDDRGEIGVQYDPKQCHEKISAELASMSTPSQAPVSMIGRNELRQAAPCVISNCTLRARIVEIGSGNDWRRQMQRRNLDLFVGTLTRATSRERGDIHFTDGYLAYDSELLTNNQEGAGGVANLAKDARLIGVLENSTNQWLAEELHREFAKLSVRPFQSFAALEGAFEQKEVDLVVVDGIMEKSMGGTGTKVKGLKQTGAWGRYIDLLGYGAEKFGIAIADDVDVKDSENEGGKKAELRQAINEALNDEPARNLINYLYDYYELETYGARRCNYKSDSCWDNQPRIKRKSN